MTPSNLHVANVIARVEQFIGEKVVSHRAVGGGYTPAIRLLCESPTACYFVKAGATPLTAEFITREIRMYGVVRGDFVPKLVVFEEHETAPLLVLEDLSSHHWPPPWETRHVDRVLAQIDAMHNTPVKIESFAQAHGAMSGHWASVAADPAPFLGLGIVDGPWLETALPALLHAEASCTTAGESLCHLDLRSDNICFGEERTLFVDWNQACLANPRLDLGFFLPSLAFEGGPQPDAILPDAPEIAAWVAGFFAARAGLPNIPDAPRVRLVQRQQLTTALPWAIRALELPPLTQMPITK